MGERKQEKKPPYHVPSMREIEQLPWNGYNVVGTFSGGGGSTTGYRMAGYHVLWSNEFIPAAQETYKANHPRAILDTRDIRTIQPQEILNAIKLQQGDIDLFDGSPPCFPGGYMVLTSCGKIPIEFCTAGMKVVTHTGKLRRISHMFKRAYHGQLYTIETKYGRKPFTCTPEHPIWARRRIVKTRDSYSRKNSSRYKSYTEPEWIAAKDLQIGDVICEPHVTGEIALGIPKVVLKQRINMQGQSGNEAFEMRLQERECSLDWKMTEIAWLLGFYLAEGHTRGRNPQLEENGPCRREVIYSVAHKETPELVQRLVDVGFHATVQKHGQGCSRVTISSPDFWVLCQVVGHYADEKFIPTTFFCMPIEWQKQFLEGYFAGDGHVSVSKRINSQMQIATTVSWAIATGIAKMVARCYGVVAGIEITRPAGLSQIQRRNVELKETYAIKYALVTSDRVRPGFVDDHGAWLPIKSISVSDPAPTDVYNMEVEEDHSYTIEDIAVHNCASFSMAGKREAAWGKVKAYSDTKQRVDDLFFEYARLLKGLQPKVFVAENVSGLIKGTAKGYFIEILKALKACGYTVEAKLLDAQWLGVPQMRQRIIFVGVRNDLVKLYGVKPVYPKPLPYNYTVREALPWIIKQGDNGGDSEGIMRDTSHAPLPIIGSGLLKENGRYASGIVESIVGIEGANGFNAHAFSDVHQPAATVQAGRSLLAQYTKVPIRAIHDTSGQFSQGDITDGPSPTITTHTHWYMEEQRVNPESDLPSCLTVEQGESKGSASLTQPTEKRKFSIAELKRICAFPDDYVLTGTYTQQWERLGRAVPPVMMYWIAKTIREQILDKIPPSRVPSSS